MSAKLKDLLSRRIPAEMLCASDPGYDDARRLFNGMIDKRPAVIVRCGETSHVVESVRFAREHGLAVAVRGGGHNVAGNAMCDDGLVLDMTAMKAVTVNPDSRSVEAQAGLTWREFDQATLPHGLAATGGLISTTGIAGLTLGGGIGYLARSHGLACDNLTSVEIVTADGRVLTASAAENADLFWGVRGGGGNFGVVTSFRYRLHPLGEVVGGVLVYPYDAGPQVLKTYRACTAQAPDELTLYCGFITNPDGMKVFAVIPFYRGPAAEAEKLLEPLRRPIAPVADLAGPAPYGQIQTQLDAAYPVGRRNYWKSTFLTGLPDEAIDLFYRRYASAPSPFCQILVEQLGGAIAAVGNDDTAFDHRHAAYNLLVLAMWTDPAQDEACLRWARETFEAVRPYSTGGVYVNYMGAEDQPRIQEAYRPAKFERLAALKARYDPSNLFRLNQNIRPAA